MNKALIFKEWLKTRLVFAIGLALTAAITAYAMVVVNRLIALKGVEHLWLIMLLKDNSFVDILKFVPLAVGIAVGAAQMVPEMQLKRLKLTLHLPCPQLGLVVIMLAVGIAELLAIYLLQLTAVWIYFIRIIPVELTMRVALSMLPWCIAGILAYIITAAVCIEGAWHRRVVIALLGVALAMICYVQPALEAYNGFLPSLVVVTLMLLILPIGSVLRFKEGLQD